MAASMKGPPGPVRRSSKVWADVSDVTAWARHCGRTLLFVDDNVFLLEMTARAFRRIGAPCRTAGTHEDAIQTVAQDDALRTVILDFDMPDGDVADLVGRIREIRPDVVLIGSSGTDRRREFADRGVDRYVPKPWGFQELVEASRITAESGF